jgi:putative ubiquitin-RnfH superfamily antitoxin RatB of RatAB toxin-antitoxin module
MADMRVCVVYCPPDVQIAINLELPAGATVRDAIERSGITRKRPEIDLASQAVGIFGERVTLDKPVENGDRIEIYRELIADPKAARRAHAARPRKPR